ncbi:MAG TPA: helix-turn-helix domain-containing protein, partial [Burkholderiaceae bacterium]|nr:helix-turn-helix domain-containing protein [Burkholderiaceae bacterium]
MSRRTKNAPLSAEPQPDIARQVGVREPTAIQVIERMMGLLDALSAHSDPVSLKHLARATGLHPSTAHRIL